MLACAGGEDESNSSGLSIGQVSATMPSGPGGEVGGEGTEGSSTAPPTSSTTPPQTSNDDDEGTPVAECGNGVVETNEECDGADLDDTTCASFGFDGGVLACLPGCTYDTSGCNMAPACGDGQLNVDLGESCDCGMGGMPCSAAQLGNQTCMGLTSPKGGPFNGGTLGCSSPQACTFNATACTYCGDGIRNAGEACEGADLGGQTCQSQGYDGGTLGCNEGCTYNVSNCESISCGDGQCQASEDSCSCPEDCPDNPNECDPCECGGQGGPSCGCDILCLYYGDCCFGGPC